MCLCLRFWTVLINCPHPLLSQTSEVIRLKLKVFVSPVIETHTKHTEPRDPTDSIATDIATETIATETIATHRDKTARSEVTSKSRGPPPTSSIQEESNLKK